MKRHACLRCNSNLGKHYYFYASTARRWALVAFSVSWSYTQPAGLLGRGISPSARPLPTHRTTQTQNKRTQTSAPWVWFDPTIPASEGTKTFMPETARPLWSAPGKPTLLKMNLLASRLFKDVLSNPYAIYHWMRREDYRRCWPCNCLERESRGL
jgi:hypothetical protein